MKENDAWLLLFDTIISNNGYYKGLKEIYSNDKSIIDYLCNDYLESADFINVYKYLDTIEEKLETQNDKNVEEVVMDLWESGEWKE